MSLRSKSSVSLKPNLNLIKELQKIAKQSATPSARRSLLKSVVVPQTTRAAATGKSYENHLEKTKITFSQGNLTGKRPATGTSGKSRVKTAAKPVKKNSESLALKRKASDASLTQSSFGKSSEIKHSALKTSSESRKNLLQHSTSPKKIIENVLKKSQTPKSSQKFTKTNSNENFLKKPLVLLSKKLQNSKVLEKVLTTLSSRTRTGTINGKQKPQNQDDFFIIQNFGQCKQQVLLGVMDGHGIFGHEVSTFVKRQLPLFIENNLPYEGDF